MPWLTRVRSQGLDARKMREPWFHVFLRMERLIVVLSVVASKVYQNLLLMALRSASRTSS